LSSTDGNENSLRGEKMKEGDWAFDSLYFSSPLSSSASFSHLMNGSSCWMKMAARSDPWGEKSKGRAREKAERTVK